MTAGSDNPDRRERHFLTPSTPVPPTRHDHERTRERLELLPANSLERARAEELLDYDEKDAYVVLVRGSEYHAPQLEVVQDGPAWLELVPEPENDSDPRAVAVHIHGTRIGYVGRRSAHWLHWRIVQFNESGYDCYLPGIVGPPDYPDEYPRDTWLALPTVQKIDAFWDLDAAMRGLARLWEDLPQDVREAVIANHFHIPDDDVAREFVARRHLAPQAGIPRVADVDAFFFPINKFLESKRLERWEIEEAKRQERNRSIVRNFESGISRQEIARAHGLSATTVSRVLRDAGAQRWQRPGTRLSGQPHIEVHGGDP